MEKQNLDELKRILNEFYCEENYSTDKRKPRQSIKHLTDSEKEDYRKEFRRLASKKYFTKNHNEDGVHETKRNYYNNYKNKQLMIQSLRYYKKDNRLELFKKRKPEYYRMAEEAGLL
mgnify:CR=1 FL=1